VRLAYDRGTLEIIMPSGLHGGLNRLLDRIITALTAELDLKIKAYGSTSLERDDREVRDRQENKVPIADFPSDALLRVGASLALALCILQRSTHPVLYLEHVPKLSNPTPATTFKWNDRDGRHYRRLRDAGYNFQTSRGRLSRPAALAM
jgi:hypothetical protein